MIMRVRRPEWQRFAIQGILACGLVLMANPAAQAQEPVDQAPVPRAEPNRDNLPDAPVNRTHLGPVPAERLTFGERFHIYTHSLTDVESVIKPALAVGIDQGTDTPSEWGQGGAGFGRRFGSAYAREVISRTIRFGVAAADHEDPRYFPSQESGFWPRAKYAVVRTFVARTDSGSQMPAFSRLAGAYGAAFISNAWYPERQADAQHALERGSTALATSVGWNVFREFWPDIRRKVHRDE